MQVEINYKKMGNLLKNRPTVKKGAALFKMASVNIVVKSKGAAKKWLWILITIQVNFVLVPSEAVYVCVLFEHRSRFFGVFVEVLMHKYRLLDY